MMEKNGAGKNRGEDICERRAGNRTFKHMRKLNVIWLNTWFYRYKLLVVHVHLPSPIRQDNYTFQPVALHLRR